MNRHASLRGGLRGRDDQLGHGHRRSGGVDHLSTLLLCENSVLPSPPSSKKVTDDVICASPSWLAWTQHHRPSVAAAGEVELGPQVVTEKVGESQVAAVRSERFRARQHGRATPRDCTRDSVSVERGVRFRNITRK